MLELAQQIDLDNDIDIPGLRNDEAEFEFGRDGSGDELLRYEEYEDADGRSAKRRRVDGGCDEDGDESI